MGLGLVRVDMDVAWDGERRETVEFLVDKGAIYAVQRRTLPGEWPTLSMRGRKSDT